MIKIEYEQQIIPHEGNHLIIVVFINPFDIKLVKKIEIMLKTHHFPVEGCKKTVFKIIIFSQAPLSSRIFVAPVIACTWEIDPFRMAEFITTEIKITPACGTECEQPDHLMKCNAPIHRETMIRFRHAGIHFSIEHPEYEGFVANHRLVVRLAIRYYLFLGPVLGKLMHQLSHIPVFIKA